MVAKEEESARLAVRIGRRLRDLRQAAGVERAQAAQALGLSAQAYVNRESGATELKCNELAILAQLFQVSPEAFFDGLDRGPGAAPDADGCDRAREAETFLHLLARIPDARLRHDIAIAVKAIAKADGAGDRDA